MWKPRFCAARSHPPVPAGADEPLRLRPLADGSTRICAAVNCSARLPRFGCSLKLKFPAPFRVPWTKVIAKSVLLRDWWHAARRLRCNQRAEFLVLAARPWTRTSSSALVQGSYMTERQWELYRLSAIKQAADSPHKDAVIRAIEHKLMTMELEKKASSKERDGRSHFLGEPG